MSAVQYMGHVEGGGLQRHSVGDIYPYIVMGVQNYGDKSLADRGGVEVPMEWVVVDSRTGHRSESFRTCLGAHIHAGGLMIRNMMHG